MKQEKRLGRGLEAILGESGREATRSGVVEIALDLLTPNSLQPRQRFDKEKLAHLAESIKARGVVQPIVVRRTDNGYEIVVGERRWRAAQMAGLSSIPAIVKDLSRSDILATALVENIQRADLNALEIASAFEKLLNEARLSHAQIARMVGMNRSSVTNYLRLLSLPESIKSDLLDRKLSMGHARALLAVSDSRKQRALADMIISRGLSVRQAEAMTKRMAERRPSREREQLPEVAALEEQLCALLGTKVVIRTGKKGNGKILIEYYSGDDLDRLLSILKG